MNQIKYNLPEGDINEWIKGTYTPEKWRHFIYGIIESRVGPIPEEDMRYLSTALKAYAWKQNEVVMEELKNTKRNVARVRRKLGRFKAQNDLLKEKLKDKNI